MGICCLAQGSETGDLCYHEEWDGEWDRREVQKGGWYMYAYG